MGTASTANKRATVTVAFALSVSLCGPAVDATPYTFATIADTGGPLFGGLGGAPTVNASGMVSYQAFFNLGGQGIFIGNDTIPLAMVTSGAFSGLSGFGNPSINANSVVAFSAGLASTGGVGIFTATGPASGLPLPRYDTSGQFAGFGDPSINQLGTTAFWASFDAGGESVVAGTGGVTPPVASTGTGFTSLGRAPSINDSGTVAFRAALSAGGDAIFTSNSASPLYNTAGQFSGFGNPSINMAGTMAFEASLDSGGKGIFVGAGGTPAEIASTSGPLSGLGTPNINSGGTVAFWATLDSGGEGIFTGPDPVQDKVVRTGDLLAGSAVVNLGLANRGGLNDHGSIAFWATLEDGRQGIFRADPATGGDPTPLPPAPAATNPGHVSRLTKLFLDNATHAVFLDHFDPTAPTYVVTHGWQPDADYESIGWDFSLQATPKGQLDISDALLNRLTQEGVDKNGNSIKANVLLFEWEGAYTGPFLHPDTDGVLHFSSIEALANTAYAGVSLGIRLGALFGAQYDNDIHFIGHSYGTIVNAGAIRILETLGLFENPNLIQFTTLDPPTNAPFDLAPNLNADWFQKNLSRRVNYLDNYFGGIGAFGEPIIGSGFDQAVVFNHSGVGSPFYKDLIQNGANARTNPLSLTGFDSGPYIHLFQDWITPILDTYNERPGNDFGVFEADQATIPVTLDLNILFGSPIIVNELPGFEGTLFDGFLMPEQSPVSVYNMLKIPTDVRWLLFDWMVGAGGDGDWISVHFEDNLLWSMFIDELIEGVLLNALIDVSAFAGMEGKLLITLNSIGEANAEFYVGNLAFLSSVSEPSPFAMLIIALLSYTLVILRRRMKEGAESPFENWFNG